jgi:hypothetical protein
LSENFFAAINAGGDGVVAAALLDALVAAKNGNAVLLVVRLVDVIVRTIH